MNRTFSQIQRLFAGLCALMFVSSIFLLPTAPWQLPCPLESTTFLKNLRPTPLPEVDCRFDPDTECYSPYVERPQQVLWG
jgi:hypothetical protein